MNKDQSILSLLKEGRLTVDGSGVVRSTVSNDPAQPLGFLTPKGYLRTNLSVDGKRIPVMVHRIVCINSYGLPPLPDMQVNHKDRSKSNNHPKNLEWSTNKSNAEHAVFTGVNRARGEECHRSKLTPEMVRDIRRRAVNAVHGEKSAMAKEYGISKNSLIAIIKGRSWKHTMERTDAE